MTVNCSSTLVNKLEQTLDFILVDSYQSYFRKLNIFFSGKLHGAIRTGRIFFFFFSLPYLDGGNDVQNSYITFDICNSSTFYGAIKKTN